MDPSLLAMFLALTSIGITTKVDGGHLDAGETGFIQRELHQVMATTYDIIKAPAKARTFIPVNNSIDTGAESFSYLQWDTIGLAKLIANYADDLPNVDAFVKEFIAPVKGLGDSYSYSIQDLRAIQRTRGRLNEMKARAARDGIEYRIDEIAAFGNTAAGLGGFLNNAAVPVVPVANGAWDESTPVADILEDLSKFVNSIPVATKTVHQADTILFDTVSWGVLKRPVGAGYEKTIMQAFLDAHPEIKNVDQWHKLNLADDGGNGRRIVCYKRDPSTCQLVIPQDFEQLPPQAKALAFVIFCHCRIGGVIFPYPLACAYMDLDD